MRSEDVQEVHLRVVLCLCFKARPTVKPFIWTLVLFTCKWTKICVWINLIPYKKLCTRTRFETETEGNSEMGYSRGWLFYLYEFVSFGDEAASTWDYRWLAMFLPTLRASSIYCMSASDSQAMQSYQLTKVRLVSVAGYAVSINPQRLDRYARCSFSIAHVGYFKFIA